MEEILHHLGCKHPINNGINYLSTGAGFQPSTVGLVNSLKVSTTSSNLWKCFCKGEFYPSSLKNHWSVLCFIPVQLIHSTNTPNKSHHIYPENTIIYDTVYTQQLPSNIHSKKTTTHTTVDGSEMRRSPAKVDSLSMYLQGFGIHPRWLFTGFLNHQPCHLTPKNPRNIIIPSNQRCSPLWPGWKQTYFTTTQPWRSEDFNHQTCL